MGGGRGYLHWPNKGGLVTTFEFGPTQATNSDTFQISFTDVCLSRVWCTQQRTVTVRQGSLVGGSSAIIAIAPSNCHLFNRIATAPTIGICGSFSLWSLIAHILCVSFPRYLDSQLFWKSEGKIEVECSVWKSSILFQQREMSELLQQPECLWSIYLTSCTTV